MDKKARRIAAMHFFAGCMNQEDVDFVWSLTQMGEDDAVAAYLDSEAVMVWEPFEGYPLAFALEGMKHLQDRIIHEIETAE